MIRKFAGFALGPLLSVLAPLITIPAVTGHYGTDGWAAIAVGQSIGLTVAVVVELGWSVSGPALAARTDSTKLYCLFRTSFRQSAFALSAALIPTLILATLLAPAHTEACVATAVAMAATGLTANWLYIGRGEARWLVLYDTLPRITASLVGALLVDLGSPLVALPLVQLCFYVGCGAWPFVLLHRYRTIGAASVDRAGVVTWRQQGWPLLARLASTVYVLLPTAILASIAPASSVAKYSSVDRIQRTYLTGLGAVTQVFQGWIPAAAGSDLRERLTRAIQINSALAGVSATLFYFVAEPVQKILFRGNVPLDRELILPFSIAIAFVVMSRCIGIQCLGSLGANRDIAISTLVGMFVGAIAVPLGAMIGGRAAVAWAVVLAEGSVLLTQVPFYRARASVLGLAAGKGSHGDG